MEMLNIVADAASVTSDRCAVATYVAARTTRTTRTIVAINDEIGLIHCSVC